MSDTLDLAADEVVSDEDAKAPHGATPMEAQMAVFAKLQAGQQFTKPAAMVDTTSWEVSLPVGVKIQARNYGWTSGARIFRTWSSVS